MNQIFKTALSGEFNRAKRGVGTFYKTALSEIRVEWNRVKRGVPVLLTYSRDPNKRVGRKFWKVKNFMLEGKSDKVG